MKLAVYNIAKLLGLFALARYFTRNQVRILAYHGVWLGSGHYGNHLFMSAEKFAHRIAWLAGSSYSVLSLEEAVKGIHLKSLSRLSVVITIDDGWYGTYLYMLPSLERHSLPATLYLTTRNVHDQTPVVDVMLGYIFSLTKSLSLDLDTLGVSDFVGKLDLENPEARDQFFARYTEYLSGLEPALRLESMRRLGHALTLDIEQLIDQRIFHLMSPDEVKDWASRGQDVQLHTHRHRVYDAGVSCVDREIDENRKYIHDLIGSNPVHFCYPSGEYDAAMWPTLRDNGVISATTTESGLAGNDSNPLNLPRIMDGEQVSDIEFEAELSGFAHLLRLIRTKLDTGSIRAVSSRVPRGFH